MPASIRHFIHVIADASDNAESRWWICCGGKSACTAWMRQIMAIAHCCDANKRSNSILSHGVPTGRLRALWKRKPRKFSSSAALTIKISCVGSGFPSVISVAAKCLSSRQAAGLPVVVGENHLRRRVNAPAIGAAMPWRASFAGPFHAKALPSVGSDHRQGRHAAAQDFPTQPVKRLH